MEKRPLLLRSCIVVAVLALFAISMYPLTQRDFYQVFMEVLKPEADREQAKRLIETAEKLQQEKKLFQSQAILEAAEQLAPKVKLTEMIAGENLVDDRDALSVIRKNASGSIRLGLDLAGGVEFYMELVPDENQPDEIKAQMESDFDHYRDVAIETLRTRLENENIYEAEIAPSGSRYVVLRAPVVQKEEKLKLMELIGTSAKLNFRMVHDQTQALVADHLQNGTPLPVGYELMPNQDNPEEPYVLVSLVSEMDGRNVSRAQVSVDEFNQRRIDLTFNQQGAVDFARVTSNNVGRRLAIVLGDKLYCAPNINQAITGGSANITGRFSQDEAENIAGALNSGSFPFQIKINAVFDTDPKLGKSNIDNGIWVGLLSIIAVAVFMLIYYRLSGLISVVALCLNVVLILGAMAAFHCTLTLPGIAGIVLTIGMAVDANVLVFERIREELNAGKNVRTAVDLGFSRALPAVLDSNLTTLLTSIILMGVGTGAIKGFAVTLSIGILSSLFTALFVSHLLFDYLFRYTSFDKIKMLKLSGKGKFDFVGVHRISYTVAAVFILLTVGMLVFRGKNVLGVDFTGGTAVTFNYEQMVPQDAIQKLLVAKGYDEPGVTYKFDISAADSEKKVEILLRGDLTKDAADQSPMDTLEGILNQAFPNAKFSGGLESSVGGLIGWEFTKTAIAAIVLSLIGIGLYITLRYEYVYAMTGVLALLNDVLIVLGLYLAMGRTVSLTVIAALLTVIGYSINDKVVIFDRIRENVKLQHGGSFTDIVNASVNQTLSRTLLTSITTFIVVFILYLGGGVAINDFVLIMMMGIIVGTASSMFVAAPTVALWQIRRQRSSGELHNMKKVR